MYKEIYIFKDKMRKYYHKTIFSFIFLLLSLTSFATELPNHYIKAFDRSIPRYRQYYESSEILKLLDATLKENNFNYKQDYISIVGYTMDYVNPSIDKYVLAIIKYSSYTYIFIILFLFLKFYTLFITFLDTRQKSFFFLYKDVRILVKIL